MTTVIAAPTSTVTLTPSVERHVSPKQYAAIAPSANTAASAAPSSTASSAQPAKNKARSNGSPGSAAPSPEANKTGSDGKLSPNSHRSGPPPMIKVKKEPSSPNPPSSRPRPRRLDLAHSMPNPRSGPQTARPSAPLTSKDSAGLAIQDVGLACLSPGFQTQDPTMREQLQRSLNVRDQQRQIIEARQKGGSARPSATHDPERTQDTTLFGAPMRTPSTSKRKGPPPGLSISAPSASQFANERVIQSAPLHQSFTGLRPGGYQPHQPSHLSQTSHIHHVPATQTANRLPPISDVFAPELAGPPSASLRPSAQYTTHSPSHPPPLHSPGYPPQQASQPPPTARGREFRSAEEAVAGMSGGREDMLPKIVHYGGVQPPTPPSPMPNQHGQQQHPQHATQYAEQRYHDSYQQHNHQAYPQTATGVPPRRRDRDEYERDLSPRSHERDPKRMSFGGRMREGEREEEDWRQGMSSREKKEEFLRLCERAWDLFHS
ncbi:hypothetical protein M8818_006207 [Zalaria obscura]|uniref:Uncharacterized protein n=1 Tax=Zalaria obscura TaxID=2024903 RepID=A0ACC3S882_9PEZI